MANYSRQFRAEMEKRLASKTVMPPKAKSYQALGRLKGRQMNKTELAYSQYLEALKAAGEVLWYEFEGVKLRLADNTFYTPDFTVMSASNELSCHETKGYMLDDANVKLKVAAEKYPWPFFLVKKAKGGNWNITKVGNK